MASDFPLALTRALDKLDITQLAFANAIGVSHSLITKLLAGEEAHRKTYQKIFAYLRDDPERRVLVKALMEAYLRDVARDIGVEDEDQAPDLKVSDRREGAIAHIFDALPNIVILAFYAIGSKAKRDDLIFNGLMNLAETAGSLDPQSGAGFPKNYFAAVLHKPAAPNRLLGGSLGDLVNNLVAYEGE